MSIARFIDLGKHSLMEDLAYISMAVALFNIAQDTKGGEGIIMVDEDENSAKKIHYRMQKLSNRMTKALHKYAHVWDDLERLRAKLLQIAIDSGYESVQPDYLATYILRFRFVRTKRIIHDEFKWLNAKGSDLLSLLDLLDNTQVSDRDDEMCDLAYKIANCL